jgi:hypothetical protein
MTWYLDKENLFVCHFLKREFEVIVTAVCRATERTQKTFQIFRAPGISLRLYLHACHNRKLRRSYKTLSSC